MIFKLLRALQNPHFHINVLYIWVNVYLKKFPQKYLYSYFFHYGLLGIILTVKKIPIV